MGWMFDYAVNTLQIKLSDFFQMFLNSNVSRNYESGDSSTIAGKSGPELVIKIISDADADINVIMPIASNTRSKEFWLGWSLSYYQWKSCKSFKQIADKISIDNMLLMYDKYHEMDIEQFVIEINRHMTFENHEAMLKRMRLYAKYTQSELSSKTGIPVRTIQQYEQKQKNINNAKADTVIKLANALYCRPEDLLEPIQTVQH